MNTRCLAPVIGPAPQEAKRFTVLLKLFTGKERHAPKRRHIDVPPLTDRWRYMHEAEVGKRGHRW